MGISDLYMGIGQKRNISHFANIVKIAKSDNKISPEEIEFLSKVSKKYNISDEKFREILRSPEDVPTLAHIECVERIERLYELLVMVKADHHIENAEVAVLRKIVTGLAFPLKLVDEIVDQSLTINLDSADVESFKRSILDLMHMK